jgi:hypothetical protein
MLFNDSFTQKLAIETTSQVRKGGLPPLLAATSVEDFASIRR